jgi:hypothetical protein
MVAGGVPGLDGGAPLAPAITMITGLVLVADMIGTDAQMGLIVARHLQISLSKGSIPCSSSLLTWLCSA